MSPTGSADAPTSDDHLFCHVYGRGRSADQLIPGRPNSFVAALESGRTSWTALLDAVRLGPEDDVTAVTAAQLREGTGRLIESGHWTIGDPDILLVMDAGYDVTRLTHLLSDLPLELIGRPGSDRVMHEGNCAVFERMPKLIRLHAERWGRRARCPSSTVALGWGRTVRESSRA